MDKSAGFVEVGLTYLRDLRHTARDLLRSRSFALMSILTIAMSTSPVIAALGVANWLYLRPPGAVPDPQRLSSLSFVRASGRGQLPRYVHPDAVQDVTRPAASVESVAGWLPDRVAVAAVGRRPELVNAEFVSWNYFDVLGVRLAQGRGFLAEEERSTGGGSVGVLSAELARREFGGSAVGKDLRVNGITVRVLGVAPVTFPGADRIRPADIWLPGQSMRRLTHWPQQNWAFPPDTGPFQKFVVRMRAGATASTVATEVGAHIRALAATAREYRLAGIEPVVRPGFAEAPAGAGGPLAAVIAMCTLLLCLGAANLTNMFGFRSLGRIRTIGLQRALGATGVRLWFPHAAESFLIAFIGTLLGLIVVTIGNQFLEGLPLTNRISIPRLAMDWRLIGMTMAVSGLIGLLMALLPGAYGTERHLSSILSSQRIDISPRMLRLRRLLAGTQLACCFALLLGALLFTSTVTNLYGVKTGAELEGVTVHSIGTFQLGYSSETDAAFYRRLISDLERRDGVNRVALAAGAAVLGGSSRQGIDRPDGTGLITARRSEASEGYFDALGVRVIAGRSFSAGDMTPSRAKAVAILSSSLARQLFGDQEPLGRQIGLEQLPPVEVVGVVADVLWSDLTEPSPPVIYLPFMAHGSPNVRVIINSSLLPSQADSTIRSAATAIDPNLPVSTTPMRQVLAERIIEQRAFAWVLGILALTGCALSFLGLYGLAAQISIERTREFGIRLALGARRADIVVLSLKSIASVVVIAIPIGLLCATSALQLVESRLFKTSLLEARVLAIACCLVLVLVGVGGTLPAWSAARANPLKTLRSE